MKCDFCGGQGGFAVYTKNGKSFCSSECEHRFFTTPDDRKQRKHAEIKSMAFEFFRDIQMVLARNGQATIENIPVLLKGAWVRAEAFYKFAKEKEGEK